MRVTGGDDQWTEITAQLDTGSTCNLMTSGTFCRLAPDDVVVEPSNTRLKFYDGSVLKPQGKRRIDVKVTDLAKPRTLEYVILEDPVQRTPLLSADTCESMGLAKMSVPLNYMGNGSTS